jgi:hypothetical protein
MGLFVVMHIGLVVLVAAHLEFEEKARIRKKMEKQIHWWDAEIERLEGLMRERELSESLLFACRSFLCCEKVS